MSNLVWSSDGGDVRQPSRDSGAPPRPPKRGKQRRPPPSDSLPADPGDGFVRLHRGKSAKGGKPGTLVVGLPGNEGDLDAVLKRYKQRIGTGGTRQHRVLVLQGDHRDKLKTLLEADGYEVKLAGG